MFLNGSEGYPKNVTQAKRALIESLLEGVSLPAGKEKLIAYAREQDPAAARELESLPEREYRALDEVGEALAPVQPSRKQEEARVPHAESGAPPGGDDYVTANPTPGAVRPDGPPSAPVGE